MYAVRKKRYIIEKEPNMVRKKQGHATTPFVTRCKKKEQRGRANNTVCDSYDQQHPCRLFPSKQQANASRTTASSTQHFWLLVPLSETEKSELRGGKHACSRHSFLLRRVQQIPLTRPCRCPKENGSRARKYYSKRTLALNPTASPPACPWRCPRDHPRSRRWGEGAA